MTFDPVFAAALRLHGTLLTYLLYLLIALAIVVALQTIGIALVCVALFLLVSAVAMLRGRASGPERATAGVAPAGSGAGGTARVFENEMT